MSDNITEVDDQNFEGEVLKASEPVLVDFWAEWCGPCLQLAPTIESIAAQYTGRAKVAKVNVDHSANTTQQFGIRGIPTLIVFKDGAEFERFVGATSKDNIARMLDRAIG